MYRIGFAGTPEFAALILKDLLENDISVVAAYSQPDKPKGRGRKLVATPVKEIALQKNIPVYQPENFKNQQSIDEFKRLNLDLFIVVAYGLILPKQILEAPTQGCLNIHFSLLPRWRGASPVQHAILAGDNETGIGLMKMAEGLDTGPIYHESKINIAPSDTSLSLFEKLIPLSSQVLLKELPQILDGQAIPTPQQTEGVTYAAKITKEHAAIDWQQPAKIIDRQVRAYFPWPTCYTYFEKERIKILQGTLVNEQSSLAAGAIHNINNHGIDVQTGNNIFRIEKLQFAGGKPILVKDLLNSKPTLFNTEKIFNSGV